MENASKIPPQNDDVKAVRWESIDVEILGMIFVKISSSADEIISTVSLVCKRWLKVLVGPYCWADIDVDKWARKTSRSDVIDDVVKKLVRRSRWKVTSFSSYRLGKGGFAYVATCGRFLTVLRIPWSEIYDDVVEKHVRSLVNVKELDISYCSWITCKGLSYFGKGCQLLTTLRRNMDSSFRYRINEVEVDDEAYAIADTMRGLCRLELANGWFGDRGLEKILTSCKLLTHLNIEGCKNVTLDGDLLAQCDQLLEFKTPRVLITDTTDELGGIDDSSEPDNGAGFSSFTLMEWSSDSE